MQLYITHAHPLCISKTAPFSKEDNVLIKTLYEQKGYNSGQFMTIFPNEDWTKSIAAEVEKYGTVDSSDRQRIARTGENFDAVESLVLSQDNINGYVKLIMDMIFVQQN